MITPELTRHSLSLREEAFCAAVLGGCTPTDAYRQVYKPQRAKPKTIHEMASRLMAKRKVCARLQELMAPIHATAQLQKEEWLTRLARIVKADVRKMFDADGRPLALEQLTENETCAIAGYEMVDLPPNSASRKTFTRIRRVRLIDKLRALELYGKAMGYYAEKRELTGPDGMPLSIENHLTVTFVNAG